jgi:Glycosyl hydrolases family 28
MRKNGMQGRQKWRFKPRRIAIITRCRPEASIHRSDHGTLRNVMLNSDHLNSNGVDPDNSATVLIEKCVFGVDDDGIAIKAGRD